MCTVDEPWPASIWFAIDSAVLIGIAYAVVPELPWPWNWYVEEAAVSTPITWPYAFTREPPESPGWIGASVSISPVSCSLSPDASSEAVMDWFSAVTLPSATEGVPPLPWALPSATTRSPSFTDDESPKLALVRPDAPSAWITATSWLWS